MTTDRDTKEEQQRLRETRQKHSLSGQRGPLRQETGEVDSGGVSREPASTLSEGSWVIMSQMVTAISQTANDLSPYHTTTVFP